MDMIIGILSTIGALSCLFASIGILRMPDFFLRLSVTVKAATMGVGLLLLGTAIYFPESSVTTKAFAIIFFLILTAPVSAHMIGRAAYFIGTPLWKETLLDDMKGMYDHENHVLRSELADDLKDQPAADPSTDTNGTSQNT